MAEHMSGNYKTSRLVRFLADIKADALEDLQVKSVGNCGSLAAAEYLDDCISLILEQQTQIADLEHRLKCEQEENKEYHRLAGDLENLYPYEEELE